MNAIIMNTQIFHFIKYDLNGPRRSQQVTFMFILTLTYVLMDNCLSLFNYRCIPTKAMIHFISIPKGRLLKYIVHIYKIRIICRIRQIFLLKYHR